MGLRLDFDFYGDTQLSRTLARVTEDLSDLTPAWEEMADSLLAAEQAQFSTEGGYASGGWSPLSPRYAAWKAKHYPGQPIMVATGDLRADLTSRPFGIESIEPHQMAIGSDNEVGGYHQRGDGNNPQRRVVELTESTRAEWVKIAQRHVFGSLS